MDARAHYIDGHWVASRGGDVRDIINPSDRSVIGKVALGTPADVDAAVAAAQRAFDHWSQTSVATRLGYLKAIHAALVARNDALADLISAEMGAPRGFARGAQAPSGAQQFHEVIRALEGYQFEYPMGTTMIRREAVGVCALITPWNWPLNQAAAKVAPALAAGCTMVLKPSELAPLDAMLLAEIIDEAGVPPGVFNLVFGTGDGVGAALSRHPGVDMVSFTGSTRAGMAVATHAAATIKRVALELGGKAPNLVLPDADFASAIPASVRTAMGNSGQSCISAARLLVPVDRVEEVKALAVATAAAMTLGPPAADPDLGPIANEAQYQRVISHIAHAISEGAQVLTGGVDGPPDLAPGLFVRPTVLAGVTPDMAIATEEVFGPVVMIMTYDGIEEAICLANATPYGLSAQLWGGDRAGMKAVAARLRVGMVHLNGAPLDPAAPFGGYKMSGHGREWGVAGLEEYLEIKSVYNGNIN
jgi:aldehyde dehydrogenase (NAD+)